MGKKALIVLGIVLLSVNGGALRAEPAEVIPGGHISGGGDPVEQGITNQLRDRFWKFLRSPVFPREAAKARGIDLAYLDAIAENVRVTTVTELSGIRPQDDDRVMINYWDSETPRIDVVSEKFKKIKSEADSLKLFIHELLGLVRYKNQNRLIDDNYVISSPWASAALEYEAGHLNGFSLESVKNQLFACYIHLYTNSPTEGDYWSYSVSRAMGRPEDNDPEYLMLPMSSGEGAYFISPHARYKTYKTHFQWGQGAIVFLPDDVSLREDMPSTGWVIAYHPSVQTYAGPTAHRYDLVDNNIQNYLGETLINETLKTQLKTENPGLYTKLEETGDLEKEVQRMRSDFAAGNAGKNIDLFKIKALTELVNEGLVDENIEGALTRMRDIIALRILGAPEDLRKTQEKVGRMIKGLEEQVKTEGPQSSLHQVIRERKALLASFKPRFDLALEKCLEVSDPVLTRAIREIQGQKAFGSGAENRQTQTVPYNGSSLRASLSTKDLSGRVPPEVSQESRMSAISADVYSGPEIAEGQKLAYSYKIPRADSACKHRDWNAEKAVTFYITTKTSQVSKYDDVKNIFTVRARGSSRVSKIDVNCSSNRGSVSFEKSSSDLSADAERAILGRADEYASLLGAAFDFDSKDSCRAFADFLNENADAISPENPVEFMVDNNAFYRVVDIKFYKTREGQR